MNIARALWCLAFVLVPVTLVHAAEINGCPIKPATLCIELDLRAAKLRNAELARADLGEAELTPAAQVSTRTGVVIAAGNVAASTANGCWARLFVRENFEGAALTLVGATEIDNVAAQWGFPWDPMYESVEVGPRATLTVFDEPGFRERTMQFKAGERVPDLDEVMGIFRTIRSARLACS